MEIILLNKMKPQNWLRLTRNGKKRNKELLEKLAEWDKNLQPTGQSNPASVLSQADLSLLNELAQHQDGWHRFVFSEVPKPWDHERLASMGLIQLTCPWKKISLTDAGRFLLTLSSVNH